MPTCFFFLVSLLAQRGGWWWVVVVGQSCHATCGVAFLGEQLDVGFYAGCHAGCFRGPKSYTNLLPSPHLAQVVCFWKFFQSLVRLSVAHVVQLTFVRCQLPTSPNTVFLLPPLLSPPSLPPTFVSSTSAFCFLIFLSSTLLERRRSGIPPNSCPGISVL